MGLELVWGWGTPKYPEVIEGFTRRDVQLIPEEERRKQGHSLIAEKSTDENTATSRSPVHWENVL